MTSRRVPQLPSFAALVRDLTSRVSRLERRTRPDTVVPVGPQATWLTVTGTAWVVVAQTVMWRRTDVIRAVVLAAAPAGATVSVRARLVAAPAPLGGTAGQVPAVTGPVESAAPGGQVVALTVGVDANPAWVHSAAALVVVEASVSAGTGTSSVTVARVDQR